MAVDTRTAPAGSVPTRQEKRPAPGHASSARRIGGWTMAWFVGPAALFLAALSLYPLLVLLRMSFSEVTPSTLLGGWNWVGLDNIIAVLGSREFWTSVVATGYFTTFLLVTNLVIGFVAASLLSGRSRSGPLVQGVMVFVWAMPPVVIGNIWKFLFSSEGLVNAALGVLHIGPVPWLSSPALAIWSIAIVASWASLPFSVILMKASMLGIPSEVFDAAAVDGAGYWQTRFRIVLPLLRPTIAILAIFTVMYGFRSFDFVYVLTKGGPGTSSATLPYLAYRDSFVRFDFSQGAATATISLLFIFLLGLAYLRTSRRELEL